ncbi:hypothetical protein [Spongiimicrobium salis]|uniref:hypothetical protein n=1 Tax=Spongiimicrobium salis TaxID=1667022 RepID=UPI00374D252D
MELSRIEELLEKYFEATATVAEEETLRAYFLNENVAPHLTQYAALFQYFSNAKEEQFTKQVPLTPKRNYMRWASIAAVAVFMFGIYFVNQPSGSETEGLSEEQKAEAVYAYNETKKALNLLAANFGRGTEKMSYLNEFEEAKQKIYNEN